MLAIPDLFLPNIPFNPLLLSGAPSHNQHLIRKALKAELTDLSTVELSCAGPSPQHNVRQSGGIPSSVTSMRRWQLMNL